MTGEREDELAELLEEVRRIAVQSRLVAADLLAGGYTSVFRGSGIEFDEVREYAEGDDPRAIDWNVTARMGRPFIKKYIDERELSVLFLLDLSGSMSAGFGAWSARQAAARVCGCLALTAVQNDDKVGLIAFSGGVDRYVPAQKGSGHALRVIRDCLALRGVSPATNMVPALEFASRVLRRHTVLFLVSDFITSGWGRALSLCARRHDVIAVRLFPPELDPPDLGLALLADPESGQAFPVDWRHAPTRAAYTANVQAWRTRTAEDLRRAGVDTMDVPLPLGPDRNAIARPILDFFRMRVLRRSRR